MTKRIILACLLFTSVFFSCKEQIKIEKGIESPVDTTALAADTTHEESVSDDENNYEQTEEPAEMRLRFQHFSLIIHDFAYSTQFEIDAHENESHFNDDEKGTESYVETLIVTSDTVHLSESLFDNTIDNTLFEVIPQNKSDRFKISYCYPTALHEMFDHLSLSEEEREQLYKNRFYKKEHTPFISVPDSANLFFKLVTLQEGEEHAHHLDGSMSETYYQKEMKRIRNKYGFRDTLIEYSSEGGAWYATLTKDGRMYGYNTGSYLIRIERYSNNALLETKYIIIYIAYGC